MPTVFLAPDPVQSTFFIPGGAVPGNGVQVGFFAAGSATPKTVYHDSAGTTPWTNPIVLDSGGNLPSGGEVWFAQGQIYKVTWAPSNDTFPPASPYRTMDNLSGINDVTVVTSEWTAAATPSFISASQFSIVGDQTAAGAADVGRRMKFTVTAGTVYGFISARSFGGGITTITMDMDGAQVLDAGLSAASYGVLTATNDSVPLLPGDRALFMDPTDSTKRVQFKLSNLNTGTTAVINIPNATSISLTANSVSTFTSSGTYNTPAFLKLARVRLQAPGGSGGGCPATPGSSCAGTNGGSGAYAEGWFTATQLGASIAVTLGPAGAATTGAGRGGSTCTFGGLLVAAGGFGGNSGTVVQSQNAALQGAVGGTTASGGTINSLGNGSGPAFWTSTGAVAVNTGGGGSVFGGAAIGGIVGSSGQQVGSAGGAFGAGGGGALSSSQGAVTSSGAGGGGVCIVEEYYL